MVSHRLYIRSLGRTADHREFPTKGRKGNPFWHLDLGCVGLIEVTLQPCMVCLKDRADPLPRKSSGNSDLDNATLHAQNDTSGSWMLTHGMRGEVSNFQLLDIVGFRSGFSFLCTRFHYHDTLASFQQPY